MTTPLRIAFGPAVCSSLAEGGDREWLVADGCGGYAMGTACGLLTQGQPGYALTWMDARVDGVGVTPRIGKAVEINALWVNGLAALRALHARLGSDPAEIAALHERARSSFATRFPAPSGGLYDVVDGPAGEDASVRPNQLLAFSLPHAPLTNPAAVDALAASLSPRSGCVADADPTHAATGCPFQAWSVAELLRVTRHRASIA